jgi:hypothetical protein
LHDWATSRPADILHSIADAVLGARLVLVEPVMLTANLSQFSELTDLIMLAMNGGRGPDGALRSKCGHRPPGSWRGGPVYSRTTTSAG